MECVVHHDVAYCSGDVYVPSEEGFEEDARDEDRGEPERRHGFVLDCLDRSLFAAASNALAADSLVLRPPSPAIGADIAVRQIRLPWSRLGIAEAT